MAILEWKITCKLNWRRKRTIISRAAEVILSHASVLTGLLWTSDKESRQSEKALRNEGREPAEFTKCVRTNTTCISSKQPNHLTNETNKSSDAASDFLLINKPFFLKALAQSKPAKWEKWRVRSRGWTLLSKPGRGSEQHYGQNEKKMLCCVGNKSQLWHVAFCFPPAVWLHLNKYTLTLSCTHRHAGAITHGTMKPGRQPAGALTQNFSRRPAMFIFTLEGTWLGSSSHQGSALEITSPLVKGRLVKSWLCRGWAGCQESRQCFRGF